MIRHLHREQFVPGEPARIWDFFATPQNLDALTPPRLRFRTVGGVAPRMYAGQLIEYRIGLMPGVWTRWLTEITHVREGSISSMSSGSGRIGSGTTSIIFRRRPAASA
jgi:ligand-binding SRPBCC domain-containing protein